ncbi:MAG TPA: hypothetical protein PL072_05235 [Phycisphaerales bacterium]|nr:hypothetical protein [Phycisphaerales bacterium]
MAWPALASRRGVTPRARRTGVLRPQRSRRPTGGAFDRWLGAALAVTVVWGVAGWVALPRWLNHEPSGLVWHQVVPVVVAAGLTIALRLRKSRGGWRG